jgi:phosphopantothenoylcysteine decarboxylase/phosphopantothenate--cysteine ligase
MLKGKTVVLGVCGSIAAYKAVSLASDLVKDGATVRVMMTEAATKFITPLTFRPITNQPVAATMWEKNPVHNIEHISLADAADVIVIAPATASTIAHLRAGTADDLVCCTVLASKAPVIIAPAMNVNMYQNRVTQENIAVLKERGFVFVGPCCGRLACGETGEGRMVEVAQIESVIKEVLGGKGSLTERRLVITAGGTKEPIDPVRYLGNRSSGKMGNALALAARDRGASVTLITAASPPENKAGIKVDIVETAAQMKKAVDGVVKQADVLLMAAAVADYTPQTAKAQKIKKNNGEFNLKLKPTADIISSIKADIIKVGFAAESENLLKNAKKKLADKKLDIIIANDITAQDSGFGSEKNKVTIIDKKDNTEELPLLSKYEVAEKILDKVEELLK